VNILIKSQDGVVGCVLMKQKEGTVSTSIKVPVKKYHVLEELKKATGDNIQDIILEGIDMIILSRSEEALKEVTKRQASIQEVITSIKHKKP
jgi:hypothetical protein